jgi:tRNA-dihydrouridine synthase
VIAPPRPARPDPAPLRIGPIELAAPVVLAPMAGVTDHAFRTLCRSFGPGLLYVSEMITARAFVEGGAKTMPRSDEPAPRSVQLYGAAPDTMHEAVRRLVDGHGIQHIDVNFGCPVPKVTRKGGGAALPVRRRLFRDIVAAAVRATTIDNVPLTVKFRIGVDDSMVTYLDAGRIAEEEGVAAITLHARTAEQRYAGPARWDAIATLKSAITTIPVLGNGDIWRAEDAAAMMAASPALVFVLDVLARHADLLVADAGETNAVRTLRRHVGWYLQGYPVGEVVRRDLRLAETRRAFDELLAPLDPTLRQVPDAAWLPRGRTDGPGPVALPDRWLDLVDDPTPPVGAELGGSGG